MRVKVYIRRGNMVMFGFGFDRRPTFGEVAANWTNSKEVCPAGEMRGDLRSTSVNATPTP